MVRVLAVRVLAVRSLPDSGRETGLPSSCTESVRGLPSSVPSTRYTFPAKKWRLRVASGAVAVANCGDCCQPLERFQPCNGRFESGVVWRAARAVPR